MMGNKTKVLSPNFIHCSRDDLIVLIARMLNSLITINDTCNPDSISPSNLTRFHSRTPPGISVYSYLARLARYSSIENAVLIATVYYIDLLSAIYSSFTLNSLTVHRFLLTATTVGSKGLCDSFCTNSHYAKVGGIHSNELDILEREFLTKVNYRILPRDLNISNCANEKKIANSKGRKGSITALQDEKSFSVEREGEEDDDEEEVDRPLKQHELRNSGYNVLDLYYRKMVSLIGNKINVDDDDVKDHHLYVIGNETDSDTRTLDTTIKTEADTLPEADYYKLMMNLFPSTHHSTINNETNESLQSSTNSSDKSVSSPLKRPIDNAYIPNGKKSSINK